jgi:hypothetical protein
MGLFSDLKGTTIGSFLLGLTGVRLKNDSGNLVVRNNADNANAEVTTSKLNVSGDGIVINSDAAGSANDWVLNLNRSASQTQNITLTLPPDDGTSGQVLQTDGDGVLSWVSAGTTADLVHVNSTTLAFGDSSPTLFSLPANAVVHKVRVIVDTPFDGSSPSLSIGLTGNTSKYMATTQVDLKGAAEDVYETNPGKAPVGTTESLLATYVPDSSSAGSARIEVHYSNPA